MIGNVLEWYDFAIYGYFAAAIGSHFFPHQEAVAQLISAFGVFAVGYLMRPVGGALIGDIGDRFGRRTALTISVAAMAIPTFLVGLLPGYETIGLAAPVALTLCAWYTASICTSTPARTNRASPTLTSEAQNS
jgi:MFS transporter, MHS family, proline/betaine transporter